MSVVGAGGSKRRHQAAPKGAKVARRMKDSSGESALAEHQKDLAVVHFEIVRVILET